MKLEKAYNGSQRKEVVISTKCHKTKEDKQRVPIFWDYFVQQYSISLQQRRNDSLVAGDVTGRSMGYFTKNLFVKENLVDSMKRTTSTTNTMCGSYYGGSGYRGCGYGGQGCGYRSSYGCGFRKLSCGSGCGYGYGSRSLCGYGCGSGCGYGYGSHSLCGYGCGSGCGSGFGCY
nr:loricrin-like [Mirounga angustirostris]